MEEQNFQTELTENEANENEPEVLNPATESQPAEEITDNPPPAPEMHSFEFAPVVPVANQKPASKGLKVFAVIMAVAILITGSCAVGYLFGYQGSSQAVGKTVEVNLAAKPKNTDALTAGEVYEKVKDSVACIVAYDEEGNSLTASGVFCSKDGYLVSNDHIYEKISNPKFIVYTADGKSYYAEFTAGDTVSDMTVLKVKGGTFKAAVFGNSDELFCGEDTVVMENIGEAGDRVTVTTGAVTSTGLRMRRESSGYSQRLIVTNHTVLNEATGGALVNMYGQVVGLTSYSNEAGLCYSIPSKLVKRFTEDMIKNGRVTTRAKLGITYQYINSVTAKVKDLEQSGAKIESVASDSDLNGKISKGDIIVAFNGTAITNEDELLNLIENCAAKQKATLTVVNESGKEKTVSFVLGVNTGDSAYQKEITTDETPQFGQNPGSGGTFDFPRGE